MKRRIKFLLLSSLLFASGSALAACNPPAVIEEPLKIEGDSKAYLGNTYQYKANKEGVIFSVDDDKIAVISNKGVLTPLKEGKVTVYAQYQDEKAELAVTIYPEKDYKTYALEVSSLPTKLTYNTGDTFDKTGRKVSLVTYMEGEVSKKQETTNYETDFDGKKFTEAGEIKVTVSSKNNYFPIASTSFTVNVVDTYKGIREQVSSLSTRTNYTLEFTNGNISYLAKFTDTGFSNGIFDKSHEYIDIKEKNGTVNQRIFLNKDGVLNASFYKEDNVLKYEVNNDYYVDSKTGEKYRLQSLYSAPSFDFRPQVDTQELTKSLSSDDTSYTFSASALSAFFEGLGFSKEEISNITLTTGKDLNKDRQVYTITNTLSLKVYDIGKTEITELKDIRDTRKGVNQYSHIIDFRNDIKLEDEKSLTLEDFPELDGTYNYYRNTDNESDNSCALVGEARSNPLPAFDEKRKNLSYDISLKLNDYQGLSIRQYLSKDKTWLFSIRYDDANHLVSYVVFYYPGSFDNYLSKDKYHSLIEKRLKLSVSVFFDDIYDKVCFFSNRVLSDTILEKASYRQLKDKSGNSLLQIETDVLDEKTAKTATNTIQSLFEANAFTKSEVKDQDGNTSYIYSKQIDGKMLSAQVGYRLDTSSTIPSHKLLVLFQC